MELGASHHLNADIFHEPNFQRAAESGMNILDIHHVN